MYPVLLIWEKIVKRNIFWLFSGMSVSIFAIFLLYTFSAGIEPDYSSVNSIFIEVSRSETAPKTDWTSIYLRKLDDWNTEFRLNNKRIYVWCEDCDNRSFDENGKHSELSVQLWYKEALSHNPQVKIEVNHIGQKIVIAEEELYIKGISFWN